MTKLRKGDFIWLKNQYSTENINNTKKLLNATGSGFCLAKFTQVTMHLGTGTTHSCHHPKPHDIPLDEISNNPAALFNTKHLQEARRQMMNGEKPSECEYCWRVENNNGISDRIYKSIEPWALTYHDEIQDSSPTDIFYPKYLEVDFSNVCNFSCAYCGPEFSSKWVEDLKQNGPIKVLDNTKHVQWVQGWQNLDDIAYKNRENNPYVDAFWKWFPEVYKHLHVFRITGGEPLLSKQTFKTMDWFMENPNTNIEFNINSNLGVPEKLWDQFIEKVKALVSGKYVKKFTVFTSVDGWGERAEYTRIGLDFEQFKNRYEQLLSIGNVRVVTMCTFNVLSITSIKQLLEWQLYLKKKYNGSDLAADWEVQYNLNLATIGKPFTERKRQNPDHNAVCGIDIPYLRSPAMLDAQIINKELVQEYLIPAINFMAENTIGNSWISHQGFEDLELEKFKRVCINIFSYISNDDNTHAIEINRAKFYDFVNELDDRHSRNFLEVFPEMTEFYFLCKSAKVSITGKTE